MRRRWIVVALIGALIIVFGLVALPLGWSTWRVIHSVDALRSTVDAQSTVDGLLAQRNEVSALAADTSRLSQELNLIAPALQAFAPLPKYGSTIAQSPALASVAAQSAAIGDRILAMLEAQPPAALIQGAGTVSNPLDAADLAATGAPEATQHGSGETLRALAAAGAQLPEVKPALETLGDTLAGIDLGQAPAELAAKLVDARAAVSLAAGGTQLGPELPWIIGAGAPRTYLLLIQNNHELRPTGGFISAFGRLVVDNGEITALDIVDSYEVFSMQSEYPPPPEPLQQYMGIPLWVARDANWSPDFPTSAQAVRKFYTQDMGERVDGVIAVDLRLVQHLVEALGSLTVPGVDGAFTAANLEARLIGLWEQPASSEGDWWSQRKDFMPLVAKAALERIQQGAVEPLALAAALQRALADRSLQIWVDNPEAERTLAELDWTGALRADPGADFLAIVDSNLGYNKVDAVMQRAADYSVQWPEGGGSAALATLTLTYTHPITVPDPGCDPSPRYGTGYASMTERCYFDYVRVYVPSGSRLVDVEGLLPEEVTSIEAEGGLQQFAGYFVLPTGETKRITLRYRLPEGLTPEGYKLVVQRQAGIAELPLRVEVGEQVMTQTVAGAARFLWP